MRKADSSRKEIELKVPEEYIGTLGVSMFVINPEVPPIVIQPNRLKDNVLTDSDLQEYSAIFRGLKPDGFYSKTGVAVNIHGLDDSSVTRVTSQAISDFQESGYDVEVVDVRKMNDISEGQLEAVGKFTDAENKGRMKATVILSDGELGFEGSGAFKLRNSCKQIRVKEYHDDDMERLFSCVLEKFTMNEQRLLEAAVIASVVPSYWTGWSVDEIRKIIHGDIAPDGGHSGIEYFHDEGHLAAKGISGYMPIGGSRIYPEVAAILRLYADREMPELIRGAESVVEFVKRKFMRDMSIARFSPAFSGHSYNTRDPWFVDIYNLLMCKPEVDTGEKSIVTDFLEGYFAYMKLQGAHYPYNSEIKNYALVRCLMNRYGSKVRVLGKDRLDRPIKVRIGNGKAFNVVEKDVNYLETAFYGAVFLAGYLGGDNSSELENLTEEKQRFAFELGLKLTEMMADNYRGNERQRRPDIYALGKYIRERLSRSSGYEVDWNGMNRYARIHMNLLENK